MTLWNNDDTMNSKYASEKYKNTISKLDHEFCQNSILKIFRKEQEDCVY